MEVDLGCGNTKSSGYVGIDRRPDSAADYFVDLDKDLIPLPDDSCELVSSCHFMEHIQHRTRLMAEMYRVVQKPDGLVRFRVPYVQSQRAFSAIEHKQFIGEFWVLANVSLRQHFREITFTYLYDPELLPYAQALLPDAPLSVVRGLFWNVVWDMIVEMKPRPEPLSMEAALVEMDAEKKVPIRAD